MLFGDILGVSDTDLALAGGLVVVVLGALGALHGRLVLVGFDRGNARALGVSPVLVDAALLVLVAVVLLVAVQGLGNLLVVAVLIAPAASARLLTRRIAPMMAAAAAIAAVGVIGGLYLSFYAGTAAGASIAAVLVGLYALVGASGALLRRARSRPQSAQEP
jgi:ABC-type Mn2+/Zn2+ transport system permease subunit